MVLSTAACHHLTENENVPGPAFFHEMKRARDLQSALQYRNLQNLRLALLVAGIFSGANDLSWKSRAWVTLIMRSIFYMLRTSMKKKKGVGSKKVPETPPEHGGRWHGNTQPLPTSGIFFSQLHTGLFTVCANRQH